MKIVDAAQIKVSGSVSAEDKDTIVSYGNTYLKVFESLVSALVKPTETQDLRNINLDSTGKEPCLHPFVLVCLVHFRNKSLSNMFFWRSPALSEWLNLKNICPLESFHEC